MASEYRHLRSDSMKRESYELLDDGDAHSGKVEIRAERDQWHISSDGPLRLVEACS